MGRDLAYRAAFVSILITTVTVLALILPRHFNLAVLVLLACAIAPYALLILFTYLERTVAAFRAIAIASWVSCMVGVVVYTSSYPPGKVGSGGGASMAALIFFFFPLMQVLLFLVAWGIFRLTRLGNSSGNSSS